MDKLYEMNNKDDGPQPPGLAWSKLKQLFYAALIRFTSFFKKYFMVMDRSFLKFNFPIFTVNTWDSRAAKYFKMRWALPADV